MPWRGSAWQMCAPSVSHGKIANSSFTDSDIPHACKSWQRTLLRPQWCVKNRQINTAHSFHPLLTTDYGRLTSSLYFFVVSALFVFVCCNSSNETPAFPTTRLRGKNP